MPRHLVDADAAILVRDDQAGDKLAATAIKLVQNKEEKLELSGSIAKLARPNAADDIASAVLKLAS